MNEIQDEWRAMYRQVLCALVAGYSSRYTTDCWQEQITGLRVFAEHEADAYASMLVKKTMQRQP